MMDEAKIREAMVTGVVLLIQRTKREKTGQRSFSHEEHKAMRTLAERVVDERLR